MFEVNVNAKVALDALADVEIAYPGFRNWWMGKVLPGLDDGTRRILMQRVDGRVTAVGVFKREAAERKICTLWSLPGAGVSEICGAGMAWLGTDRPSFSVSQEMMPRYRRVLAAIDAGRYDAVRGMYRPGTSEFVFDGKK